MVDVISRVRRRMWWNQLAAQAAHAVSFAMGLLVLLLVTGTEILGWRWVIILPVIMFVAGIWVAGRKLPKLYAVAQLVDARLKLADTLSTAFFFSTGKFAGCASETVRLAQWRQAVHASHSVNASQAVPFTVPRGIYVSTALAIVAAGLVAVRYGVERRLDLRPPIAAILQQLLQDPKTELAKLQEEKKQNAPEDPATRKDDGAESSAAGKKDGNTKGGPESEIQAAMGSSGENGKSEAAQNDATSADESQDQEQAGSENSSGQTGTEAQRQAAGKKDSSGRPAQSDQQGGGSPRSGAAEDSQSLMSRLSDAMQNLLSRLKPQSGAARGQQQTAMNRGARRQGERQQNRQSGAQSSSGDRSQDGSQTGDRGEQQGQESQQGQNGQARGTGQTADEKSSKQPGNGAGKNDGNKDARLAEQLDAMGKISVILGKRSENLTGEVTVETVSGDQQLTTAYVHQNANHANAGTAISRDEVPLSLQSYVQEYFEQVRKYGPASGSHARRTRTANSQ